MHGINKKKKISRQIICEDKIYVVVVGDGKGEMESEKKQHQSWHYKLNLLQKILQKERIRKIRLFQKNDETIEHIHNNGK